MSSAELLGALSFEDCWVTAIDGFWPKSHRWGKNVIQQSASILQFSILDKSCLVSYFKGTEKPSRPRNFLTVATLSSFRIRCSWIRFLHIYQPNSIKFKKEYTTIGIWGMTYQPCILSLATNAISSTFKYFTAALSTLLFPVIFVHHLGRFQQAVWPWDLHRSTRPKGFRTWLEAWFTARWERMI